MRSSIESTCAPRTTNSPRAGSEVPVRVPEADAAPPCARAPRASTLAAPSAVVAVRMVRRSKLFLRMALPAMNSVWPSMDIHPGACAPLRGQRQSILTGRIGCVSGGAVDDRSARLRSDQEQFLLLTLYPWSGEGEHVRLGRIVRARRE